MKLAFSTLGCPGWSIEQVAERARSLGYQGVELRLLDGEVIPPDLPVARRTQVKRVLGDAGIEVACLDTSCRFTAPEAAERRKQEDDLRRYFDLAREWDTTLIRTFGGNLASGQAEADGVALLAESLNNVSGAAEQAGVTVALETHDAFSAGRTVAEVLRRVPSRSIAALWDTHHPYRMGETVQQTWEYVGGRMVHTHVKDARRDPSERTGWQLVLLGEGEVPVKDAVQFWQQRGYEGYVCVEWEKKWHPEIPEPEVAFPQHIQKLREYLGQ